MILVDTNVLVDVLEDDPEWVGWSIAQLRNLSASHDLAVNPIIFAELSLTFSAVEDLNHVIDMMHIRFLEIPREALFMAGKAFARYRRRGGQKSNVLGGFFIGAHTAVADMTLLTRDPRRYDSYFPTVKVISPGLHRLTPSG